MALVRFEPARELDSLQSDMNRLFDGFFGGRGPNGGSGRWIPAMDLVESDEELVLRADLPGVDKDDVSIEVKDNVLTVSGERKTESEDKGEGYYRIERAFGSFSRALTLPEGVDSEAVKADFKDGVLEVRIPKPEERQPKRIAIGKRAVEGKAEEKK